MSEAEGLVRRHINATRRCYSITMGWCKDENGYTGDRCEEKLLGQGTFQLRGMEGFLRAEQLAWEDAARKLE